jgi:hypothetical protein
MGENTLDNALQIGIHMRFFLNIHKLNLDYFGVLNQGVKKSEMLSKYFFNCMGFLKSSKMVY